MHGLFSGRQVRMETEPGGKPHRAAPGGPDGLKGGWNISTMAHSPVPSLLFFVSVLCSLTRPHSAAHI